MPYVGLGSRGPLTATTDTSGFNQGKFTSFFDSAQLDSNVPFYEVYSMSVTGLVQVATISVYVNGTVRSTAKLLGNSEWDPSQPILMNPGDTLALAWDFSTGTAPAATIWLRYDISIPQNVGKF